MVTHCDQARYLTKVGIRSECVTVTRKKLAGQLACGNQGWDYAPLFLPGAPRSKQLCRRYLRKLITALVLPAREAGCLEKLRLIQQLGGWQSLAVLYEHLLGDAEVPEASGRNR